MGDYAAAPDYGVIEKFWLLPEVWDGGTDSGSDGLHRPTEDEALGHLQSYARRLTEREQRYLRWIESTRDHFIAEIEHDCTPLALKRMARGETPLWVADTRRGVRVWIRMGE